MRLGISALILLLVQRVSLAHVPGSEQTVLERIGHQFFGAHHLPISILIAVVAVLAVRQYLKRSSNASE
ncbi:MAG: hypothetical protein QNJ05_09690 [Woeseiaceae bacterium]|nr:hypothetical protein [Woeseiaceae bacterium]